MENFRLMGYASNRSTPSAMSWRGRLLLTVLRLWMT